MHWSDLARFPALPDRSGDGDNREGDAQSVWFRLSRAETEALTRVAAVRNGTAPHAALLAGFAAALSVGRR